MSEAFQIPFLPADNRNSNTVMIPIDDLPPDEELDIPKGHPSKEMLESLSDRGQIEPIQVAKLPEGKYFVVTGNKRLVAFRRLRAVMPNPEAWDKIWAIVRDETYEAALTAGSTLTSVRYDNALTQMKAIRYLEAKYPGIEEKTLSRMTGMSIQTLRKRRKLFKLNDGLKRGLEDKMITTAVADAAADLPVQMQDMLVQKMVSRDKKGKLRGLSLEDIKDVQRVSREEKIAPYTQSLFPTVPAPQPAPQKQLLGYALLYTKSGLLSQLYTEDELALALDALQVGPGIEILKVEVWG